MIDDSLMLDHLIIQKYTTEFPEASTRNLSQQCLNELAKVLPGFLGGSANVASSSMTLLNKFGNFQKHTPKSATSASE